jgi:hypothetical protein
MTSPTLHIEFFFRANQFRRAYMKLPLDSEPPDWPKYVLFYHAIELALKAYLIQCGVSVEELRDEYRHDLKKLVNDAVKRGLSLAGWLQGNDRGRRRAARQTRSGRCGTSPTDTLSARQCSVLSRAVRPLH